MALIVLHHTPKQSTAGYPSCSNKVDLSVGLVRCFWENCVCVSHLCAGVAGWWGAAPWELPAHQLPQPEAPDPRALGSEAASTWMAPGLGFTLWWTSQNAALFCLAAIFNKTENKFQEHINLLYLLYVTSSYWHQCKSRVIRIRLI